MATVELNNENFETMVGGKDLVIVDFWAPWCGPCVSFAPTYEKVSEKYPGILFGKVNTEVEQALGGYFKIRSIPTLMVFREKVIVYSEAGALPELGLEQLIAQILKLDMEEVHRQVATQSQE